MFIGSQLHFVTGSDLVEDVEAVVDCFLVCPYDDVFVGRVGELSAGMGNGFKHCYAAKIGQLEIFSVRLRPNIARTILQSLLKLKSP